MQAKGKHQSTQQKTGLWQKLRPAASHAAATLPALELAVRHAAQSIHSGRHKQRRAGTGETFWQYREYTDTDRPQDIDWRQSAKGDRVFIRQREWQTTQTALFWCQNDASSAYQSHKDIRTKAHENTFLALTLATLALEAHEQIAPLTAPTRAGRTENALHRLGDSILSAQTQALPQATATDIPRHSTIFLIGDFLASLQELKHALQPLEERAEHIVIVQCLDPAELDFPFEGSVIFKPADNEQNAAQNHIPHTGSIRTAYQARINDHIGSLKALCKQRGWAYVLHRTDQNASQTLLPLIQNLAPQSYNGKAGAS